MSLIKLGRETYRDKVLACWLGKNIGGTLGMPYELKKHTHDLTFFDPVPTEPEANDDLDLQLVWLKMLEDIGRAPRLPDFAAYWKRYLIRFPWNEYGFCRRNFERGLMPPVSGWFENYFVDEMGAPIRSEIWACVHPADPQRAAAMAWRDAALDHAGGEGTHGEMFWSAVQSAAFVLDDPFELIRLGLSMIGPACDIARVIREAVWCYRNGLKWGEARERIVTTFGSVEPCNAIPNHGFMILGWLYGDDFGDRLCKAVNCGFDTDCTGATLGALLGILGGTQAIPKRWSDPIGRNIVLHEFTGEFNAPKTVEELTDRTAAMAERFVADSSTVTFANRTELAGDAKSALFRNADAQAALRQDICAAAEMDGDVEITLHFGGEPVMYPNLGRRMSVTCCRGETPVSGLVQLHVPHNWKVTPVADSDDATFDIEADTVEDANTVEVIAEIDGRSCRASFAVLGPNQAQGVGARVRVEQLPQ